MKSFSPVLIALVLSALCVNAQPVDLTPQWDNGFKLASDDGAFQLGAGAQLQVDMGGTWPINTFPQEIDTGRNRMLLRRARPYMKGVLHDHVKFKLQVELAKGAIQMRDVFMTIRNIPGIHNITIGHFKEPFLHDFLSSSSTLMFTERALPFDLVPKRNAGVMLHRPFFNERLAVFGGVFSSVGPLFNTDDLGGNFAFTGRVAGLPLWQNDGDHLLHLGGAYSARNPTDSEFAISVRPESFVARNYLTPSSLPDISGVHLFAGEVTWHHSAFTLQGEYAEARQVAAHDQAATHPVRSYFAQFSWMINGSRNYDKSNMTLDRVSINNVLMGDGKGVGGLELAARYSSLELPGWPYDYRSMQNVSLGINWYLTPGVKMTGNYIASFVEGERSDIAQFRFHLAF